MQFTGTLKVEKNFIGIRGYCSGQGLETPKGKKLITTLHQKSIYNPAIQTCELEMKLFAVTANGKWESKLMLSAVITANRGKACFCSFSVFNSYTYICLLFIHYIHSDIRIVNKAVN